MNVEVITKSNGGRVYVVDGVAVPSVTTILGMLNKPALVPWAAKMTAEAYTAIIKRAVYNKGAFDFEAFEKEAKSAHRTKKKDSADAGTAVHDAIETYLDKGILPVSEDPRVINGFNAFIAWTEENDVEVLAFENVICDVEKRFAGRYDLLANINGVKTLVDFKTGNSIYPEYWLQLAAYGSCVPGIEDVAIIKIDKESGGFEYQVRAYSHEDYQRFSLLADYYKLSKQEAQNGK